MILNFIARLAAALGLLMLSGVLAFAHHGVDPSYDNAHPTTLKGTVTAFEFINPHAKLSIDVKDASGNIEKWSAELGSPNSLRRNGWNKDTLKPGDEISFTGAAAKDGAKKMVLHKFSFADGREGPQAGGLVE
jgi:uncharacterized protein DUF6152